MLDPDDEDAGWELSCCSNAESSNRKCSNKKYSNEQSSNEQSSNERCSGERCSGERCSGEKCSGKKCSGKRCSNEKRSNENYSNGTSSNGKCSDGEEDHDDAMCQDDNLDKAQQAEDDSEEVKAEGWVAEAEPGAGKGNHKPGDCEDCERVSKPIPAREQAR
jgi:hypothetical protein